MSDDKNFVSQDEDEFEQMLVDDIFGELDEKDARVLRDKLSQDPGLSARRTDLQNTFDAIGLSEQPEVPEGLADKTLAWIDSVKQTNTLINIEQLGSGYRPTFALKEILAIAAMFILAVSVIFSSVHVARVKGKQNICMSQMGEIGSALNNYAMNNNSVMPTALDSSNPNWLSHGGANQPSNSSSLFRLLKQKHLTNPTVFQCPAVRGTSFAMDDNMRDFPSRKHINYSYQYSMGNHHINTSKASPELAILSDENPYFTGGKYDSSHQYSRNHKYGQAVLYVDGRCKWKDNSNAGINGDQIFLPGKGNGKYTGQETPTSKNDSFLLPN